MARLSFELINAGLDQLYFSPLLDEESVDDRAESIQKFITLNGWTWDSYIEKLSEPEESTVYDNVCSPSSGSSLPARGIFLN